MLPFLAIIRNKNFRNLWLGQITSQVAINMLTFVLVLRIYERTSSNTAVSLLILVIGIPAIVFGFLAGTLVDRWDKRNVLVVSNLLRMLLLLGFFITSETLFWVYALVLAISISTQFFVPAEAPTIPRIVPKEFLLTANSLFTFTYYTSVITGYALSGPALRFFGPHKIFLFLAVLLALAAFFVSQLPKEEKKEKPKFGKDELTAVWREFLGGLSFLRSKEKVFEAILLLTVSQALIASLAALTPGFAHQVLGIEVKDASYLIMGPAAIGILIGAILVGQFGRNFSKLKLINTGIIIAGLALLLISLLAGLGYLTVFMVLLLVLGAANALIDVPANTILQEKAPAELRGRVYGVLTSFVGGAAILPVMVTGLAADFLGIEKVIFMVAGFILILGIYRVTKERYNREV